MAVVGFYGQIWRLWVFIDSYGFPMGIMGFHRPILFFSDEYRLSMEFFFFPLSVIGFQWKLWAFIGYYEFSLAFMFF